MRLNRLPVPPPQYDRANEAAFRREIERLLSDDIGLEVPASTTDPISREVPIFLGDTLGGSAFWFGNGGYFQAGTHGGAWDATLMRPVKKITVSLGSGYARLGPMIEIGSLMDPAYAGADLKLRMRETLALSFSTATPPAAATYQARARWGVSGLPNGASTVLLREYAPFIGFQMIYDSPFASPNSDIKWACHIVDSSLTAIYTQSTTVDAKEIHDFELEFDCSTATVNFYIDGVLVGSYTFASGTTPGQVTPYPAPIGTVAGAFYMLWEAMETHSGGVVMPMVFNFHLSPAAPCVSMLFGNTQ